MTPHDFLQEIIASPDDDTPRLIYADWLDERGDPRGEFIRVQCELATLTRPAATPWNGMYGAPSPYSSPKKAVRAASDLPRFQQLLQRQLALSMTHSPAWVQPFQRHVSGVLFSRGFVEGCAVRAVDFVEQADHWFRQSPLRQLHVKHIGEFLAAMLRSPHLLRLHTLEFNVSGRRLHDHEAQLLAICPNLANLRNLSLGYNEIGARGIQAILDSVHLQGLQNLRGINYQQSTSLRSAVQARFGHP
jgi:uncharacterized protein (TIGR02996 family)